MDRNTILGFLLIGLVLMVWMYFNAPPPPPPGQAAKDSIAAAAKRLPAAETPQAPPAAAKRSGEPSDTLGKYFAAADKGSEKRFYIETDDYRAEITTMGGSVRSWVEKKFKTWDGYPVNLIAGNEGGNFNLLFATSDGKL